MYFYQILDFLLIIAIVIIIFAIIGNVAKALIPGFGGKGMKIAAAAIIILFISKFAAKKLAQAQCFGMTISPKRTSDMQLSYGLFVSPKQGTSKNLLDNAGVLVSIDNAITVITKKFPFIRYDGLYNENGEKIKFSLQ